MRQNTQKAFFCIEMESSRCRQREGESRPGVRIGGRWGAVIARARKSRHWLCEESKFTGKFGRLTMTTQQRVQSERVTGRGDSLLWILRVRDGSLLLFLSLGWWRVRGFISEPPCFDFKGGTDLGRRRYMEFVCFGGSQMEYRTNWRGKVWKQLILFLIQYRDGKMIGKCLVHAKR